MIKAVYTGTFDPVTNGHLDIIERASKMYDVLYVTIFINPHKTCLFSVEERIEMLREATKQFPNVVIDESSALAVEYAREVGAQVLLHVSWLLPSFHLSEHLYHHLRNQERLAV